MNINLTSKAECYLPIINYFLRSPNHSRIGEESNPSKIWGGGVTLW